MSFNKRRRTSGGWLAPLLGGLGVSAATYLGQPQLAVPAYNLGYLAGSRFKEITGYGAYTIRRNTLMGIPGVSNPNYIEGATVISHKEYLGDVVTGPANTFSTSYFPINPGQSLAWEWLAQIACNYEEWVPQGIVYYYKSTSSDALSSTNTALGTVIMATQYNISPYTEPGFSSKAEMECYQYSTSGLPSSDLIHGVECDPMQLPVSVLQVRSNGNYSGDLRFSDLGRLYIATSGFQAANVTIGELWVTYQIALLKPKLFASLGYASDYFYCENTYDNGSHPLGNMNVTQFIMSTGNTIPIFPFDNGIIRDGYKIGKPGSPGFQLVCSSNSLQLIFPTYCFPTTYMIEYHYYTDSTSSGTVSIAAYAGTTGVVPTVISSELSPILGVFAQDHFFSAHVLAPAQPPALQYSGYVQPYVVISANPTADAEHMCLRITQVTNGSNLPLTHQ